MHDWQRGRLLLQRCCRRLRGRVPSESDHHVDDRVGRNAVGLDGWISVEHAHETRHGLYATVHSDEKTAGGGLTATMMPVYPL